MAQLAGDPDAGPEMHFSFIDLIAHIAKTRSVHRGHDPGERHRLEQGSRARRSSCLAERRMIGRPSRRGAPDYAVHEGGRHHSRIEMLDEAGGSVFGAIEQRVVGVG
jgi:fumarylacetoacetate (FAA) hydrolase